MRAFAISDIHGCHSTFRSLLEEIIKLEKSDKVFLLGDYIDRGPSSKQVLDYILDLKNNGYDLTLLLGNHEQLMLNALINPDELMVWLRNGGDKTLESFKVKDIKEVPQEYFELLQSMHLHSSYDGYILVHAGFNFLLDDIYEDTDSMIWLRNFKVDPSKTGKRTVVHGHTPCPISDIKLAIENSKDSYRINIDNGCVYGFNEFYGNLCALELNSKEIYLQKNQDNISR